MATDTPTTRTNAERSQADDVARGARETVGEAADTVRGVAADVAARLPDAAATTKSAIVEADRQMRAGSDEMLSAGTTLAFGLAVGLLVGGANRVLVALALIPAAAMGVTLIDRATRRTKPGRSQGS
jgi:hypothetical protein